MQLQKTITRQLPTADLGPTYRRIVEEFNHWLQGRKLSPLAIRDFLLSNGHKSLATVSLQKQALKKALLQSIGPRITLAQRAQLDLLFKEIKVGHIESKVPQSKVLSPEEIETLLENSTERNKLIIRFLSETGVRIAEMLNARLENCTIQKSYVFIKIVGKGMKERTIFIKREFFDEINQEFQGQVFLFESASHRKLDPANVWFSIKQASRAIGRHVHPHMFRHSFATNTLLLKGKSLKAISNYLGHSTTAITADMYVHDALKPEDLFAGSLA